MRFFFLMLGVCIASFALAQDTLFSVNGLPVSKAEHDREMQRYRSVVVAAVARDYHIYPGGNFWDSMLPNGKTPMQLLNDTATVALISIKVQEGVLIGNGLWKPFTGKALNDSLQAENHRRKLAKQRGEIIYGPVEYAAMDYYDYLFSNAVQQLKLRLLNNRITGQDSFSVCLNAYSAVSQNRRDKYESWFGTCLQNVLSTVRLDTVKTK